MSEGGLKRGFRCNWPGKIRLEQGFIVVVDVRHSIFGGIFLAATKIDLSGLVWQAAC